MSVNPVDYDVSNSETNGQISRDYFDTVMPAATISAPASMVNQTLQAVVANGRSRANIKMMADEPKDKKKEKVMTPQEYERFVTKLEKDSLNEFSKLSKQVDKVIEQGRIAPQPNIDDFVDRKLWEY